MLIVGINVCYVPIADLAHERWDREIREGEFADKGRLPARLES